MSNNDKLEKLESKLDKLDERLDSIDKTLAINTTILEEHQRRSVALEDNVAEIEKHFIAELKPVKTHVDFMRISAKVLMWLGGGIVAILGALETLRVLGLF